MVLFIERALCVPKSKLITNEVRKIIKKKNKKRKFCYDFSTDTVFVKQYASDPLKITLASCIDFLQMLKRNNVRITQSILFFTSDLVFNKEPHLIVSENVPEDYTAVILYGSPNGITLHSKELSLVKCKTVGAFVLSSSHFTNFISIGKRILGSKSSGSGGGNCDAISNVLNELDGNIYMPNENRVGSEMYIQGPSSSSKTNTNNNTIDTVAPPKIVITEDEKGNSLSSDTTISTTTTVHIEVPNIPECDLPLVSLITPTFCNENVFFITIMSFLRQSYPADKLEWIIIDDTPEQYGKSVMDILPREDDRINYCHIKSPKRVPLGKKLNIGIEKARGDIIVHFFDSVFYPAESVLYRVSTLLDQIIKKTNKIVVGSTNVGCYHLIRKDSFSYTEHDKNGVFNIFQEPSLAYHKNLWHFRHFSELIIEDNVKNVLSIVWLRDLYHFMLDLPYMPVCVRLLADIDASKKTLSTFGGNTTTQAPKADLHATFPPQIKDAIELVHQGLVRDMARRKQ